MRSISLQVREPWLPDGKIIEVERKLKPEELVRTIPIPKEKPLLKYFLEWVETGKPETYIFYSYHDPQKPFSRFNGNKILRKADPEGKLWPHLLRHIRCSELVRRYGFDWAKLVKWNNWTDLRMADRYAKLKPKDLIPI